MAKKTATVVGARELKNRLGSYLRAVENGASIVVTERGRPVAQIVPLSRGETALDVHLDELAAMGELTRATLRDLPEFEPERVRGGPVSDTIIEDREDRF